MPNFTACQLHIPHKLLSPELLAVPGVDLHQLKLGLIARDNALRENWSAIERFLNEVAPNCFGGGTGCGVPGPHDPDHEPVANGVNACAEGDGTVADSPQSVVMGKNNTVTADSNDNSVIAGGHDNLIDDISPNSIILAGDNNQILNASASTVTGESNICRGDESFMSGSGNLIKTGCNTASVSGNNSIVDEGSGGTVEGSGAVAWTDTQHAHSNGFALDDVSGSGLARSSGQYSRIPAQLSAVSGPFSLGVITFADLPYLTYITGNVIARDDIADVGSVWTFDAVVATDGAGGCRFIGSPVPTLVAQDVAAVTWTVTVTLTGFDFALTVTGDATDQTDWSSVMHLTEVLGGTSL